MNITAIDQNLRALHEQLAKGEITVEAKAIIRGWVFTFEPIGQRWLYRNEEGSITGHEVTLDAALSVALPPLVE